MALASRTPDSVLQTLAWTKKHGFKAVQLHPRSKAAVSRDYVDPSYQTPDDASWRRGDYGIGIVTGPQHAGPVDIDLDCPEARTIADRFLPPTPGIFGRASSPKSHYLFRVSDEYALKVAYVDPFQKSTIIEFRGDGGHQTVLPGSVHPDSGEMVCWDRDAADFPILPTVSGAALQRSTALIAVCVLVARGAWSQGQRNEVCLLLSGLLCQLKVTQDEAELVIQSIMDLTGDDDKTRLHTVKSTYAKGEKGKPIKGGPKLRKLLGEETLVDRIYEWLGTDESTSLHEYNERFACGFVGSKFRIASLSVPPTAPPIFHTQEDFLRGYAAEYEIIKGKPASKAKSWLGNPARRQFSNVDFIPGATELEGVLNLWTGWAVAPDPAGDCSAWLELLRDVICGGNDELYQWMVHWFANIVREPCRKSLTAPVIIGPQGAGKSLLVGYFGRILGSYYTPVTNAEHIHGKFNAHMATTLLLHSEEALYGGDKRHRSIIKSLITDEHTVLELKGIDAKSIRNYLRLILTSNDSHAAPAEAGDRRFTVIDLDKRKASPELIKRLVEEMRGSGPAALLYHLLTIDYDPALPRTTYKTTALGEMKIQGLNSVESWWHSVLMSGQLLPTELAWASKPIEDPWPMVVSLKALFVAFLIELAARRVNTLETMGTFAPKLYKYVGRKLEKKQRRFTNPMAEHAPPQASILSDDRQYAVEMPSLAECRAAFESHMGGSLEWPEEEDEGDKPTIRY